MISLIHMTLSQEIMNVGKDEGKTVHSYTADGTENWYNLYGKQDGNSSEN